MTARKPLHKKHPAETAAGTLGLPAAFWAAIAKHDWVAAGLALAAAVLPAVITWWRKTHPRSRLA